MRVRVCACVFVGVSFVYAAVFGVYLLVICRLCLIRCIYVCAHLWFDIVCVMCVYG